MFTVERREGRRETEGWKNTRRKRRRRRRRTLECEEKE